MEGVINCDFGGIRMELGGLKGGELERLMSENLQVSNIFNYRSVE